MFVGGFFYDHMTTNDQSPKPKLTVQLGLFKVEVPATEGGFVKAAAFVVPLVALLAVLYVAAVLGEGIAVDLLRRFLPGG